MDFLTISIVGSILLTLALNLFPMLFPNTADKMQRKLEESARRSIEQQADDSQPNVKLFFPWKAMLVGSVVLTVLVNVVGYVSR